MTAHSRINGHVWLGLFIEERGLSSALQVGRSGLTEQKRASYAVGSERLRQWVTEWEEKDRKADALARSAHAPALRAGMRAKRRPR